MENAVGYIRLSRDEDKQNYSSIINQKNIIIDYCEKNNIKIIDFYIDDNYSGYTFERPSFKKMLLDLENKNIDVIIAKDLSRIGRHNARTLLFLESITELNKNIILIDEQSGGYNLKKDDDSMIGIKTWVNEMYVKDISKKIRSSFTSKQKEGTLVFKAPFGYKKDKISKSDLLIDEETSQYVKLIFELYLQGNGYIKICNILNDKNIPTPSIVQQRDLSNNGKIFKNKVSKIWQSHHIQRIIKDDVYTGSLRCGKTRKQAIKGKTIYQDKDLHILHENHHEPIISLDDFSMAQDVKNKRNKTHYKGGSKNTYMFSGFVFCNDCGGYMIGRTYKNGVKYYECGKYSKYGLKQCTTHYIKETLLINLFKIYLQKVKNQIEEFIKDINIENHEKDINEIIKTLKNEYIIKKEELKTILSEKIKALINEKKDEYKDIVEQSYKEIEEEKKEEINFISNRLNKLNNTKDDDIYIKTKNSIDLYSNLIESNNFKKKELELILDKIMVNHQRDVDINLISNINDFIG